MCNFNVGFLSTDPTFGVCWCVCMCVLVKLGVVYSRREGGYDYPLNPFNLIPDYFLYIFSDLNCLRSSLLFFPFCSLYIERGCYLLPSSVDYIYD